MGLTLTVGAFAAIGLPAPRSTAGGGVAAAATPTLDFEFYDFFNVPFQEFWDYRTAVYGDLPINAECFTAEGIANGICTPVLADVADVPSYPYTSWYPSPGDLFPGQADNNPFIYAQYRFRATGRELPGYNLSEPVFLPVANYGAPPGNRLDFNWEMHYVGSALADSLNARGCPLSRSDLDGFQTYSVITLTMDLQESKRLFGVVATDPTSAQAWWGTNTNPQCFLRGSAETAVQSWFTRMGGTQNTIGKYDIANSFEWYYNSYFVDMRATVDPDGTTHVTIEHAAWGTDVLLARWFYWGNTSYRDSYLDSRNARGWWGMELAWLEDMTFSGGLTSTALNFQLASAMTYHLWELALPGSDGLVNQVGDVPYWNWGPVLSDYTNDWQAPHPISELDRYLSLSPTTPYKYMHTSPGSQQYGVNRSYDIVPHVWNPKAGETWHFQFPTGNVVFYDPNLTRKGANPVAGEYVEIRSPLALQNIRPAGFGTWDGTAMTWHVVGPLSTGGPSGNPGADGIPGTADDQYPLWMAPEINLGVGAALAPSLMRITTNIDAHPTWGVPGKIMIDDIPRDEWGLAWMEIAPGSHTISFTDIANLETPPAVSVVSNPGETITHNGEYKAKGWLRVMTDPPVPGTISVNGVPRNEWGMWMAMSPGTYTVSFGAVQDFVAPGPETVMVAAEALTTVVGRYTYTPGTPGPDPASYGLLRVTTRLSDGQPGVMTQIEVDGIPRDEWGLAWLKLPPGTYTLTFSDVWNFGTPGPQTFTITAGMTTTLEGVFQVQGWLRVMTNPPVPGTIYVNGEPRNAWGMWQAMPIGTYSVTYGDVPGFTKPAAETATVTAWTLTTVVGTYT